MVVEKTNTFGMLVNGTWSGMRGHLQRGVSEKNYLEKNLNLILSNQIKY